MTRIKYIVLATFFITLTNCSSDKHQIPVDKRYWDINDYDKIVRELRFGYENDEKLPTFDDPNTRTIVEKLTDEENYKVVLDDNELGLNHRNEIAGKFFNEWQDMNHIYVATDRKDQYLYGKENLAVWHFGLGLQLKYFKLGNDVIKEDADDPNSAGVKNTINTNVVYLIKNYLIYLDMINHEEAFSEEGKAMLAEGINTYFPQLIALYPDANYGGMRNKAELMLKKSNSDEIKSSLNKLIQLIDSNASDNK